MLAFKKNIYEPPAGEAPRLAPYPFILHALSADRNILTGLLSRITEEDLKRYQVLFPHASRFATLPLLDALSRRLLDALVRRDVWYGMNAYHLCYIYDSLLGLVEDYSYESREKRLKMMPELNGAPVPFDAFLEEYFPNTAFLIAPERMNTMSADEKALAGFNDPCLFGVVNKFIPSEEEMALPLLPGNPYRAAG
jgi:hypothetical protein